jgi:hypothetical protein
MVTRGGSTIPHGSFQRVEPSPCKGNDEPFTDACFPSNDQPDATVSGRRRPLRETTRRRCLEFCFVGGKAGGNM